MNGGDDDKVMASQPHTTIMWHRVAVSGVGCACGFGTPNFETAQRIVYCVAPVGEINVHLDVSGEYKGRMDCRHWETEVADAMAGRKARQSQLSYVLQNFTGFCD